MIEEIKKELDELEKQMVRLVKRRKVLRDQIAVLMTSLRPGDLVTTDGGVRVWKLKTVVAGYDGKPSYFGYRIKKNGQPGAVCREIWEASYKTLVKWEGRQDDSGTEA